MARIVFLSILAFASAAAPALAYQINGYYARLISCEYGWSAVRGEYGNTGTYEVSGEIWTVYFGQDSCEY